MSALVSTTYDSNYKPKFPEIDCFCPDHPWRNIVFICLKPDCNIYPRISCPACVLQKHQQHLSDLIELKEVYLQTSGSIIQLNYPKDSISNDLKSLSNNSTKLLSIDHIDNMMDKLKHELNEQIEEVRGTLKKKVSNHLDLYNQAQEELTSLFWKAYSLEDVRIALDNYHIQKINLEELNLEIHRFANSEVRFSLIKQAQQRLNRLKAEFDTMFYENVYGHFSKKIFEDIDMLKMAVESMKHKSRIEELFRKKDDFPTWALDIVRPFRKDSVILRDREFDLINKFLGSKNVKYTLLYRGSRDGLNSKVFHAKCDGKNPTVVICQSKLYDKIFGGVCFAKWSSPHQGQYVADNKAFLFSITHQTKHEIQNEENAYFMKDNYGPTFGSGQDLMLTNDFSKCQANLGQTYQAIVGDYQSEQAKSYLGGASQFDLKEIETYMIEIN